MLTDMCNYAWVPFSSRVKPKHGNLRGYQPTASYPDDQHYRTVMLKFHVNKRYM